MKRYRTVHETKYQYGLPVELGLHTARMSPIATSRQKLVEHHLEVTPEPAWSVVFTDHFGNSMHHIAIEIPHDTLTVTQRAVVEIASPDPDLPPSGPPWETVRNAVNADAFPAHVDVAEFIYPSPLVTIDEAAVAFAEQVFIADAPVASAALELARKFKTEFAYVPGSTTIATPVPEILKERRGVCQDFAHAMIAGLRGVGLPARYVSGYIKTYPAVSGADQDVALIGADASHAWISVWCGPDLGWLEFDPTNALAITDEHIVVAYGRDFSDVTPLRGVINGGGQHTLGVAVSVELLADTPSS